MSLFDSGADSDSEEIVGLFTRVEALPLLLCFVFVIIKPKRPLYINYNFFALCEKVARLTGTTEMTSACWFDYVLHDVVGQQFSLRVFFRPHPSKKNQNPK